MWRWSVIARSDNVPVANGQNVPPFVVILEHNQRVDHALQRCLAFSVTWDLPYDELVMIFRSMQTTKIDQCYELECDDMDHKD